MRSLCVIGSTYVEYIPSPAFVCLFLFLKWACYVALAVLELKIQTRVASNSQFLCLYFEVQDHRCGVPPAGSFCFLERGSF